MIGKLEWTTQKEGEERRDLNKGKRVRMRAGGWDWLVKEKGTELWRGGRETRSDSGLNSSCRVDESDSLNMETRNERHKDLKLELEINNGVCHRTGHEENLGWGQKRRHRERIWK